jgi:hypothetical protein
MGQTIRSFVFVVIYIINTLSLNFSKFSIFNIPLEKADVSIIQKVKKIAGLYVVYFVAALVLNIPLQLTDKLIVKQFFDFSFYQQLEVNALKITSRYGDYAIFYVVLIGPFLEELLFRLPLSLKKIGIGVSFALIYYRLSVNHILIGSEHNNVYWYVKLGIALCILFLTVRFLPGSWLTTIKENYLQLCLYFSSAAFALVHITNFAPYNSDLMLLYPVFVLPQFLMGMFIGYARLKYGFLYGVALHGLINLPFAIIHL